MLVEPGVESGAVFSECRRWRYQLWRIWDRSLAVCAVVGLNPSKADEKWNDRTVAKCVRYSRKWGYGALYMLNIYGYCSTYPSELERMSAKLDIVGPENDYWILETLKLVESSGGIMIGAWGNHGRLLGRGEAVRQLLPNLYRLGTLTKPGFPRHPLYLKGDLKPEPY